MGHLQSLVLPRSKRWREVVDLLKAEGSAEEVAGQAAKAVEAALQHSASDQAFHDATRMLVELPLAARAPGFADFLAEHGIDPDTLISAPDLLAGVSESLDRVEASSDLGEMARLALVGALGAELDERLPSLFPPGPEDVRAALGKLAGGPGFSEFARRYFARLTNQVLCYYLSRTLAEHTGEDRRFGNDADRVAFSQALEQHTWEASGIVSEFAAGWYGKTVWRGNGLTPEKIDRFASYALKKMRDELLRRRHDG